MLRGTLRRARRGVALPLGAEHLDEERVVGQVGGGAARGQIVLARDADEPDGGQLDEQRPEAIRAVGGAAPRHVLEQRAVHPALAVLHQRLVVQPGDVCGGERGGAGGG